MHISRISLKEAVMAEIKQRFGAEPEYLWARTPDACVFRHSGSRKWFGIIMNVQYAKLGIDRSGAADVLNVKCSPLLTGSLLMSEGVLPAWHMNKNSWVSILLDGTVPVEQVISLVEMSFALTSGKKDGSGQSGEWLIPANPRVYDLEQGFAADGTLLWHNRGSIHSGDTVYIYMGAPASAILYMCRVVEDGLRVSFSGNGKNITEAVRLELMRRFDKELLPLALLRECGVYGVRSARRVPAALSERIKLIIGNEQGGAL